MNAKPNLRGGSVLPQPQPKPGAIPSTRGNRPTRFRKGFIVIRQQFEKSTLQCFELRGLRPCSDDHPRRGLIRFGEQHVEGNRSRSGGFEFSHHACQNRARPWPLADSFERLVVDVDYADRMRDRTVAATGADNHRKPPCGPGSMACGSARRRKRYGGKRKEGEQRDCRTRSEAPFAQLHATSASSPHGRRPCSRVSRNQYGSDLRRPCRHDRGPPEPPVPKERSSTILACNSPRTAGNRQPAIVSLSL